jgi:hypothetical protein
MESSLTSSWAIRQPRNPSVRLYYVSFACAAAEFDHGLQVKSPFAIPELKLCKFIEKHTAFNLREVWLRFVLYTL